jgi:hypothetical protein
VTRVTFAARPAIQRNVLSAFRKRDASPLAAIDTRATARGTAPVYAPGHSTMADDSPQITGRDVAGAGALMLSVNIFCAGAGAGLGALAGATAAGLIAGFFVGFFLAIMVVIKRFQRP